jgi:Icc-related predicted phosphoesterase
MPRRAQGEACAYRRWEEGAAPRSIVAIGDLQRTILAEQLYLGRRQNDAVRAALVEAVSAEQPDVILLLGDQVSDGAIDREWYYFDELLASLRDGNTAVHALPGNHDYSRFDRERSERNFFSRFAWPAPAEPDVVRLGPVVYVGLDSNFDVIGPERVQREAERYRELLDELDRDETVRGVIVASHHPPFSNSRLQATAPVIELFAEPFLAAKKTRLYLSAHVHSYERFESEGKTFVVSGGGGGPRRKVDVSDARRWRNDVFRGGAIRPFHYLQLAVDDEAITVVAKMLNEPMRRWQRRSRLVTPEFVPGDEFRVPL